MELSNLQVRIDRYTKRGEPDDCWLWTGTCTGGTVSPYPSIGFTTDGKRIQRRVSRVVHCIMHNKVLSDIDGLDCRHTCDTPLCVNPKHILIGTRAQNIQDKVDRDRQAKGASVNTVKLNERGVLRIRELHATGEYTLERLGKMHGIHLATIQRIVTRKTWKHI